MNMVWMVAVDGVRESAGTAECGNSGVVGEEMTVGAGDKKALEETD